MHLAPALVPEAEFVRALEANGGGFLQRADAAVADARVRRRHVLDQLFRADQPADAPAGGVEVLPRRTDGEGQVSDFGGQRGDSGEGDVVETVVDLW